jgi:NADH dehydrogenase (ubiquinone) 1 beta subcomplex subunit 7
MIATEEEMEAAKLELGERDYCAHKLLDYRKCRSENFPYVANCKHEKHAYLTCEFDE